MKTILAALALMAMTTTGFARSPGAAPPRVMVPAERLVAKLYKPVGVEGRLPAVIVLGGSEGGMSPGVADEARLLARHGYAALQLAYFGTPGVPQFLQLIPLEYFKAAIDWLSLQPEIDPEEIGIVGTSTGGETALVVAAHYPQVKAVVAAVPSSMIWPGIGAFNTKTASSFTFAGRPLPDLPYGWTGAVHDTYALYSGGLRGRDAHPDAVIPVENINGPVMLVCGKLDQVWPSCPMSDQIVARLRAERFTHPVQRLDYPNAGHAVFGPPLAPTSHSFHDLGLLGGTAAANDLARHDDWPKSLEFLDAALKRKPIPRDRRLGS